MILQARQVVNCVADCDLVSKMRASVLVFGPLLARVGSASLNFPPRWMCYWSTETIDLHMNGMAPLGADHFI